MTAIDAEPPGRPPVDAHGEPGHDPHLAHHFSSLDQQFEAAKLGMWLFLGTEILLFGGLFCAYAVFRRSHPEIFTYGSAFLDVRWGALNTLVLIMSSLTMATAVTASQQGRTRLLLAMLLATFLGGVGFMGVKYIEYHHKFHEHLVWGLDFYEKPDWVRSAEAHARLDARLETLFARTAAVSAMSGDADRGRELWSAVCRSCHGVAGEGVAGQGKDLRGSSFIGERDDAQLVAFLEVGRTASDPLNTTGIQMPAKGGNPLLKARDLYDLVAYARTFEPGAGASTDDGGAAAAAPDTAGAAFFVPASSIPAGPEGPRGFSMDPAEETGPVIVPHHTVDPDRPANAHLFFGIYFGMTGLHGLHVLAGLAIIGWLFVRSALGEFGPDYFTPVDLGGLYWHIVDIIWIFLFPLLYLI